MNRKVAIIGVGNTEYTSIRKETRSKAELAFAAIKSSLDSIGLSIGDIEALIFTSVDGFEGNVRPSRTLEAFGQGHHMPLIDVNTGGTAGGSGIKEAVHLIAAGLYDLVLVYGSPTFGEVVDNQQILVTNPYAHLRESCTLQEVLASPMIAWPLHLLECCPISSGAAAVILASEEKAKELCDTPAWVKAISSITDTFLTGYKVYKDFEKLRILAKKIYSTVGIKNPREEIDVAEIFNPFTPFELLEYEALGFCGEGEAVKILRDGVTDMEGDIAVNPSGGVLCTNSGISASLTRHAEIALQLMGKAEGRQVKSPEVGLAHSWGGNQGQFHTLAILSR
jgi:acetyl-CoA C-acetyltransferase